MSNAQTPVPVSPTDLFFPDCPPAQNAGFDCAKFENYYSQRLRELGEKPLQYSFDANVTDVYRITIFAFTGPVPVRTARIVVRNNSIVEIVAKTEEFDDRVRTTMQAELSQADSNEFNSLLKWKRFSLMTFDTRSSCMEGRRIRDGESVLLEAAHGTQFHVIQRQNPNHYSSCDPSSTLLTDLFDRLNQIGAWHVTDTTRQEQMPSTTPNG